MKIFSVIGTLAIFPRDVAYHRRDPQHFYPLHLYERSVTDRNPVGSDDARL